MRISAVTPMKNEGPFILEWLVWHRLVGFNDFLVFTNDCEDGTDLILERLDELGLVRHLPNPSMSVQSENHHWHVMRYVNTSPRLLRSDWYASFDVDEFWVIKTGAGRIEDLAAALPEAEFISAPQIDFGCDGHETFDPDTPVTARFLRSANYREIAPDGSVRKKGIKTLVRRGAPVARIGNHSPWIDPEAADRTVWVNGSGERLPAEMLGNQIKSLRGPQLGSDLVHLNHYVLRSMEDFLVKSDRGDANHADNAPRAPYFRQHNKNVVANETALAFQSDLRDGIDELLKDAELRRLHEASVAHRRARIAELRATPEGAALMDRMKAIHAKSEAARAA